jgi:hypothetical protein
MMSMRPSCPLAVVLFLVIPALSAVAQTDQVGWAVVGAGSGTAATDHGMRASLGEPLLGVSSQGDVVLHTGFLTNPFFLEMLTPVQPDRRNELPATCALSQNYPNPFNPVTNIEYAVTGTRDPGSVVSVVRLVVYDILGREVATLVNEPQAPGAYAARWDASQSVAGVYWYTLSVGNFRETRKMLLLR